MNMSTELRRRVPFHVFFGVNQILSLHFYKIICRLLFVEGKECHVPITIHEENDTPYSHPLIERFDVKAMTVTPPNH